MSLDDLPLFSPRAPDEGERRKSEGMAQADSAEPDFWKDRADAAIKALAAEGRDFTAEDVRHLAGSPTHPNAFGSRFLSAARRGIIRKVGYRNSNRPSLHAHPIAVWSGAK